MTTESAQNYSYEPKMNIRKIIYPLLILLCLTSLSCVKLVRNIPVERGHYYLNPGIDFRTIGKVVIFELDNQSSQPDIAKGITETLTESLQKRHIFTLRRLHPNDADWKSLDLDNADSRSIEELAKMKESLNADAAIFGSVTQYYPYPHLLVGLHLKMVNLKNGKLIWAMEQVWDSSDKNLERRMKIYFDRQMRTGFQPLDWQLFVTSPRAFNKFVTTEIADTFPEPGYSTTLHASATGN